MLCPEYFFSFVEPMAKSIKHILKKELKIKAGGKLWLESEGERFFGPGPMELLEKMKKPAQSVTQQRQ